jgi:5-methyltetrahydrofolate--homocysteine methyltransferase
MHIAEQVEAAAASRILVKDGAYGTEIQALRLAEAEYRGNIQVERDQRGNNDLLNLTQPAVVREICGNYAIAGADILATNSFNANRISQSDYGTEHLVRQINVAAATIACSVAASHSTSDGRPRFVAGAIGPTNKTLSMSPDVNDPGFREIDFDTLSSVYREQVEALIEGGVDIILIETVFDTLNAKAAIHAVRAIERHSGREIPIILSMTITDLSGRNLSGHSIEAFWVSIRHARPLAVGLNCSFGAAQLRAHVAALAREAETLIIAYPNAGLPNQLGDYDERAETTAAQIRAWADQGLVNIVGGCCGTTPDHIRAIADAVTGCSPRSLPSAGSRLQLSGLDPLTLA